MELDINRRTALAVPLVFLLGGLILGQISSGISGKTEVYCPCDENTSYDEMSCNDVSKTDYLFRTGLLDIYSPQEGEEIIVCEDGEKVDERIEYPENPEYKLSILGKAYSLG